MYLTLDFESAYDTTCKPQYSLRSLTVIEYVRDRRFQVFGASVKVDNQPSVWLTHNDLVDYFGSLDWSQVNLVGHNLMFDAFVLAFHYGHKAARYFDTLSMARYVYGQSIKGHSLADVYLAATGRHAKSQVAALRELDGVFSPTPYQLQRLGDYAKDDADEAYACFVAMFPHVPAVEHDRMSWCVRMFIEPVLMLDPAKLEEVHFFERTQKQHMLGKVGQDAKTMRSNQQFAKLLLDAGVTDIPMKRSKATGKDTYAFSKDDKDFVDLLDSPLPQVPDLVRARIRVKTSIEETRAKRLADVHRRMGGWLPVPLNYCGAMPTNRLSGGEKLNLQNLGRGSKLRDAIVAPPGYLICAADLSNIELRIAMAVAKEHAKVELLRQGEDLYCLFAGKLYRMTVTKKDKTERMVGKVSCIAEGQRVLTDRGLVAIEGVRETDLLWDGVEWVSHDGVVCNGEKEVIYHDGLWATPDHRVRVGDAWVHHQRAADTQASITRSGDGWRAVRVVDGGQDGPVRRQDRVPVRLRGYALGKRAQSGARQDPRVRKLRQTDCACRDGQAAQTRQRDATTLREPKQHQLRKLRWAGHRVSLPLCERCGAVDTQEPARVGEQVYRPDRQRRALRGWQPATRESKREPSQQTKHRAGIVAGPKRAVAGVGREPVLLHRMQPQGGRGHVWRGYNTKRRARRSGEAQGVAHPTRKARVYDIVNCGPRNRFTCEGRLVHNCLSLNYQSGADTYRQMLFVMGDGMWVDKQFAQGTVQLYRDDHPMLVNTWKALQQYIVAMSQGSGIANPTGAPLDFTKDGIVSPSGFRIKYPKVEGRNAKNQWGGVSMQYSYLRHSKDNPSGRDNIYGGKCIAGDAEVLTNDRGWVRLDSVTPESKVWDGHQFVEHSGLAFKGVKDTICFNNVDLTPEHRVWDGSWTEAEKADAEGALRQIKSGSYQGLDWHYLRGDTDRDRPARSVDGWPPLGCSVSAVLCETVPPYKRLDQVYQSRQKVRRMRHLEHPARHVEAPSVLRLAINARQVQAIQPPGMGQLRWEGHNSMRPVGDVRAVLEGHGANISQRPAAGQAGQRAGVQQGQLPVGSPPRQRQQQAQQSLRRVQRCPRVGERGGTHIWSESQHDHVPVEQGLDSRVRAVRSRAVYDLVNCGPNHRFMVRPAGGGAPFIVHNCLENICQMLAREVLADIQDRVRSQCGLLPALQVHDELVYVIPEAWEHSFPVYMESEMGKPLGWWPELPLAAEAAVGKSYGEAK